MDDKHLVFDFRGSGGDDEQHVQKNEEMSSNLLKRDKKYSHLAGETSNANTNQRFSINNSDSDQPGLTRHALYKEALYTAFHYLGKPTLRYVASKEELLMYIHSAFPAPYEDQVSTSQEVMGERYPITIINAKVRELEGLPSEGDTYCLVSIDTEDIGLFFQQLEGKEWARVSFSSSSSPSSNVAAATKETHKKHKQNDKRKKPEKRLDQIYSDLPNSIKTSIQYHSSHPTWNQGFQCVELHPNADVFTLEVWEHNEKTLHGIKHSIGTKTPIIVHNGVDDVERGFRRGKKDIFLGKFTVKVKEIPCDGEEVWFNLTGITHRNHAAKGRVLLSIWMTHIYRHGRPVDENTEPRRTLSNLWDYILDYESKHFEGTSHWDGKLPPVATCLLFQYAIQNGISVAYQGFIKWKAYSKHDLELSGVTSILSELKLSLGKMHDEHLENWRPEIESALLQILNDKILSILRNHLLGETQEKVRQALKSIQNILAILKLFHFHESIGRINTHVKNHIKLSILDWYEVRFHETVTLNYTKATSDYELIHWYKEMVVQVNQVLVEGMSKWSILFWIEGYIDYMPIMYNELQKMLVFDVEEISWRLTWIPYSNNDKLRRILLRLNEADIKQCQNLYELYHQTQIFVEKPKEIILNTNEKVFHPLYDYHEWFRPALMLWLGYAFIRSCTMIKKSIHIDNVVVEDEFINTSSSSLDTRVVFIQLSTFWTELNWPVVVENYTIARFLIGVIAHNGILYAILKSGKIEHEGYFDTIDRFDISERLCIALNNIETVKLAVLDAYIKFDTHKLIAQLEKEIGVVAAEKERIELESIMSESIKEIHDKVGLILVGIKSRIKPEMRPGIKESLSKASKNPAEGLENLLSYLEDNFVILVKRLVASIFMIVLQVFWKAFCEELVEAIQHYPLNDPNEKKEFFSHVKEIIQEVMSYFKGDGSGLSDDEIYCTEFHAVEKLISK